MNFLDLLIRMPREKISQATVKPKYFMHIAATAQRLATGWKSGMIYVSESHVSYCPLPHPGNSANSCQLIFGKEGRNKGLILCVCVFKFSRRSVSGSWLFEGVSFLWCTLSPSKHCYQFLLSIGELSRHSSGDPPCL